MLPIPEYSVENTQGLNGSTIASNRNNQSINKSMNRSYNNSFNTNSKNKALKKSNWMADENPTKSGPTKIANTTHELILYDQLNSRDKELLEKS